MRPPEYVADLSTADKRLKLSVVFPDCCPCAGTKASISRDRPDELIYLLEHYPGEPVFYSPTSRQFCPCPCNYYVKTIDVADDAGAMQVTLSRLDRNDVASFLSNLADHPLRVVLPQELSAELCSETDGRCVQQSHDTPAELARLVGSNRLISYDTQRRRFAIRATNVDFIARMVRVDGDGMLWVFCVDVDGKLIESDPQFPHLPGHVLI
jgi:hypothetical protein